MVIHDLMHLCDVVFFFAVTACFGSDLTALNGIDSIYILLQGLGVLGVGFTFLTIAPTLIPAPEVSLYTLGETVLGPVWVYLGGYEAPSPFAVAGGTILLVALIVHRWVETCSGHVTDITILSLLLLISFYLS